MLQIETNFPVGFLMSRSATTRGGFWGQLLQFEILTGGFSDCLDL